MSNKITVGLIVNGESAHVSAYLPALAAAEQCDRVLLADPDGRWEGPAKQTLKDKLAGTFPNSERMLKEQPALCLISLEAKIAPAYIDAALSANSHVFAEKPACVSAAAFQRLKDKADSKHRYLMLALANRTNPEITAARRLFASGQLGKLFGVELHLVADQTRLTRKGYHGQWFADKERAGGGHLAWLGIHWLDLAMYITGESIAKVAGFTQNIGEQPINIEDSAVAAVQFDNGALGTVTSGYYLDRGYHSHIKIWGSRGWLQLEPHGGALLKWQSYEGEQAGKEQMMEIDREPRGYTPFVQAAVAACAAATDAPQAASDVVEPPISNDDSLRAIKTVYSIYRAAADSATQTISSP